MITKRISFVHTSKPVIDHTLATCPKSKIAGKMVAKISILSFISRNVRFVKKWYSAQFYLFKCWLDLIQNLFWWMYGRTAISCILYRRPCDFPMSGPHSPFIPKIFSNTKFSLCTQNFFQQTCAYISITKGATLQTVWDLLG